MAYYVPRLKKWEGHVPRVPQQIAPMYTTTKTFMLKRSFATQAIPMTVRTDNGTQQFLKSLKNLRVSGSSITLLLHRATPKAMARQNYPSKSGSH